MSKKLFRSRTDCMIAGVCGGIAEYFDLDPIIVRLILLLAFFGGGLGFFAYVIAWLLIPVEENNLDQTSLSCTDGPPNVPDEDQQDSEKRKKIFAFVLLGSGLLFLCREFFAWFNLKLILPVALIAFGLYLLLGTRRTDK
ncbi:phage shock protein C, PspC [Syntrophobotulus glycolicus DSM 8271]|uniref:Phage shock protein C, PspC n=1 Tax=Syntrophobotulus glycolicus (strain DSM 8271 / FlGlyR) TaxID=645991 RepID=F0SY54_SYNGF|nr:PspC domain-containing protein [Syntrophobotulus glycolicus]ADY54804.1 phage shock protein C, PspC [Syntrophobotulus glycolicus DSM 8271]